MAKQYLIAGNWKMNLNMHEASLLVHDLSKKIHAYRDVEVVLAPTNLHVQPLSREIDRRKFRLATQNAYHKDNGAFTGEISYAQLRHLVQYAIIGHSERRLYFKETLEVVRDKVAAALRNDIMPIICIGETKQERQDRETKQVLHDQIVSALANVTSEDIHKIIFAYEPIWAISTFGGELAKPSDVEQVLKFIRAQVAELYGTKAAKELRILYGGSVDDQIARGYLQLPDCAGALVGGASLNAHKFAGIIEAAHSLAREQHGKE